MSGIDEKLHSMLLRLHAEGLNLDIFAGGVLRLVNMEKSRRQPHGERNRRRYLKKTLECVKELEKRLHSGGLDLNPHSKTVDYLQQSRRVIESDLNMWTTENTGRGPTPETRILVALIACVREQTGKPHWNELHRLVSGSYRAAGVRRICTLGMMKQLWKRPDLRKNWRLTLLGFPQCGKLSVLQSARLRHTFPSGKRKK